MYLESVYLTYPSLLGEKQELNGQKMTLGAQMNHGGLMTSQDCKITS